MRGVGGTSRVLKGLLSSLVIASGVTVGMSSVASATSFPGGFTAKVSGSAAAATSPYGSSVTLSETGLPGSTGGTVSFCSTTETPLCSFTLSTATTSCSYSIALTPSATAYEVYGRWSGGAASTYTPTSSTNDVALTVTKAPAPAFTAYVTGSTSAATSTYGSSVVLSEGGLSPATAGAVSFSTSRATLCTITLSTSCSYTVKLAGTATYGVQGTWTGNNDDATGRSANTVELTVATAKPVVTVLIDGSASVSADYGSSVTLSETGLPGPTGGTVAFSSTTDAPLCTFTLSTSTSSCTYTVITLMPTLTYHVHAVWPGSSDYSALTFTSNVALSVAKATAPAFTAELTGSESSSSKAYDSPLTLSESGLPTTAGGTVGFFSTNDVPLCSFTLSTSTTSCSYTEKLTATALYEIHASWSNVADYTTAISTNLIAVTVTKAAAPSFIAEVTGSTSAFASYHSSVRLSEVGLPGRPVAPWPSTRRQVRSCAGSVDIDDVLL